MNGRSRPFLPVFKERGSGLAAICHFPSISVELGSPYVYDFPSISRVRPRTEESFVRIMFRRRGSTKQKASESSISSMRTIVVFGFDLSFFSAFVSLLLFRRSSSFFSLESLSAGKMLPSSQLANTRKAICCILFFDWLQGIVSLSFFYPFQNCPFLLVPIRFLLSLYFIQIPLLFISLLPIPFRCSSSNSFSFHSDSSPFCCSSSNS